jgi:hypothetical protein
MTGAIPVLLSNKGYGLMWDNYSPSYFYGAEAGNTKFKYVSESGTMVDYYFFYGPDFDHIIASYRAATGAIYQWIALCRIGFIGSRMSLGLTIYGPRDFLIQRGWWTSFTKQTSTR